MLKNLSFVFALISIFVFSLLAFFPILSGNADSPAAHPAALLTTIVRDSSARAQYCNPAVISYLVRDENGNRLKETELKSICDNLPKSIDDARISTGDVLFAEDGKSFYWSESHHRQKGIRVPALEFINNSTCTMRLTSVTLTYNNKKMRLIFNIDIARSQPDRRPVIDSLPFQEGTFELDLKGWSRETHQMIPAERWKQVKNKS